MCVPVRAGISIGRFNYNFSKSMYAGPALIEAYYTGESSKWLGITFSESAGQIACDLAMKSRNSDIVVEWNAPIKNGVKSCYVVNWPAIFSHDFTVEPPISIRQFYEAFENSFGPYKNLPADVQNKYSNTVEFINGYLASALSLNQRV
jgi:hypothetical protein